MAAAKSLFDNFILAAFRLWLPVQHFYRYTWKIWLLAIRYKGKKNIPAEKMEEVFSNLDFTGFIRTSDVVMTIRGAAILCNRNELDLKLYLIAAGYINHTCTFEEMAIFHALREAENPRQATLDAMLENGDLTQSMINFYFTGERGEKFKTFVATGNPLEIKEILDK